MKVSMYVSKWYLSKCRILKCRISQVPYLSSAFGLGRSQKRSRCLEDIVEAFRGDLHLQTIDELRSRPDETQQSAFAF
jgi:hypothetical protein